MRVDALGAETEPNSKPSGRHGCLVRAKRNEPQRVGLRTGAVNPASALSCKVQRRATEEMNRNAPITLTLASICFLTQLCIAEDSFKQENVLFRNGDTALAGTLTLPLTRIPCPAVVIIHAAGLVSRND